MAVAAEGSSPLRSRLTRGADCPALCSLHFLLSPNVIVARHGLFGQMFAFLVQCSIAVNRYHDELHKMSGATPLQRSFRRRRHRYNITIGCFLVSFLFSWLLL